MFSSQRHRSKLIRVFLATMFAIASSAMAQPPELPTASSNYRLGPGDVIRVTVLKQDILSQDGLRISNEGTVRLPMLDEPVRAACFTEGELSSVITDRYKKYILNPQVYVSVREFNSNSVAVIGAVNAPGRFQLQRSVRLLELLTLVNGPSPAAGEDIQVLRSENPGCGTAETGEGMPDGGPEIMTVNIAELLKGSENANPVLRGGDIVSVAEAELRQAFVIGSVRAATTVNLRDPVALSTAIAMAGGTANGAQIEKIKISRQIPGSLSKNDVYVDLKAIKKGEREDVLLQPNDIVDVPGPNGTKRFIKDIFRSVIPVFTRAPIIIP